MPGLYSVAERKSPKKGRPYTLRPFASLRASGGGRRQGGGAAGHRRVAEQDLPRIHLQLATGDHGEQLVRHRLQGAERTGEPVTVWVNPAQPDESIVDRSLRPGLLALQLGLALVFGAFGGNIVFWMARTLWRKLRDPATA